VLLAQYCGNAGDVTTRLMLGYKRNLLSNSGSLTNDGN
jgi:hypothetical protein